MVAPARAAVAARLDSMTTFGELTSAYLDAATAADPVFATDIGDHRHDDRWPDAGPTARTDRLAFVAHWQAAFEAVDPASLSPEDALDRDIVLDALAAQRFADEVLQEERWNPLDWVYLLGEGLFLLLSREFAPLDVRLASIAGRLERIPELLDGARATLVGATDGRPVGRFQTETALTQLPGIAELIDETIAAAEAATDGDAVRAVRPRLDAAAATARAALTAFEEHLRSVVLPASVGEARLGGELFARKMRHTMRSATLTPERILTAAEREFDAVRAEMVRLAGDLWPTWCAGVDRPSDDGALVRGVLDAIAAEHPEADDLLAFCRAENDRIEAFCRERDLIGLGDEPMDIRWTPTFLRAFGGAMLIAPGPLDRGLTTFFAITPMPDDWPPERRESYLREDNSRMLRLLTIHEANPGHYLQGVYANRSASLTRAVFASGLFAEGWAVYVTQVMMDVGYGADDPALLLTHWKFYLRSVTNAILDARIHVDGIDEAAALDLMVGQGFQEEAEARAKYDRARLSSTQLSTYFAGSMEMWAIELEARRRAAGDPDLRPMRDLPGGFGTTAGFRYRDHLEAVLSHGAPPTAILRRALFD